VPEYAQMGLQAASMTDYHLGVVAKVKEVAHNMLFAHCIMNLEHLAVKKLIQTCAIQRSENCQ